MLKMYKAYYKDGHRERKKKPNVKILGDYCCRKCNIFHPENAISGPFKALKNRNSGKNLRLPIPDTTDYHQNKFFHGD